jgi:hypothetical protein
MTNCVNYLKREEKFASITLPMIIEGHRLSETFNYMYQLSTLVNHRHFGPHEKKIFNLDSYPCYPGVFPPSKRPYLCQKVPILVNCHHVAPRRGGAETVFNAEDAAHPCRGVLSAVSIDFAPAERNSIQSRRKHLEQLPQGVPATMHGKNQS